MPRWPGTCTDSGGYRAPVERSTLISVDPNRWYIAEKRLDLESLLHVSCACCSLIDQEVYATHAIYLGWMETVDIPSAFQTFKCIKEIYISYLLNVFLSLEF